MLFTALDLENHFDRYFINTTDAELEDFGVVVQNRIKQRLADKEKRETVPEYAWKDMNRLAKVFFDLLEIHGYKKVKLTNVIHIQVCAATNGLVGVMSDSVINEDCLAIESVVGMGIAQNISLKKNLQKIQNAYSELYKYVKTIAKKYGYDITDLFTKLGVDVYYEYGIIDIQHVLKD